MNQLDRTLIARDGSSQEVAANRAMASASDPSTAAGGSFAGLRFAIASLLLLYGFAKLNGSQFTILDSELDKPMGQVSGFWLTWYYFGYSKIYSTCIALGEIGGGILLTFRQTTLLGICILLPMATNIILIDILFGIDYSALLLALAIEAGLLFLLRAYGRELYQVLWVNPRRLYSGASVRGAARLAAWSSRAATVIATFLFSYWLANFNNRVPTPLDGKWKVVSAASMLPKGEPTMVFFEYNRAFMCVFKLADGSYQQHHFEVDPRRNSIGIWDRWLSKGTQLFQGHYDLQGARLILAGSPPGQARQIWVLERQP
jgi:hypothetical protein